MEQLLLYMLPRVMYWVMGPIHQGAYPSPGTMRLEDNLLALFQTLEVGHLSTGETHTPHWFLGSIHCSTTPNCGISISAAAVPWRCSPLGLWWFSLFESVLYFYYLNRLSNFRCKTKNKTAIATIIFLLNVRPAFINVKFCFFHDITILTSSNNKS